METEIVFPNLRGVEISTSCGSESQPCISRIFWCARLNAPGPSCLKKIRAHARMYWSWKTFWWYDRSQPRRSRASSALRHAWILAKPFIPSKVSYLRMKDEIAHAGARRSSLPSASYTMRS
eukprot:3937303-Rhodomonas_salina.1